MTVSDFHLRKPENKTHSRMKYAILASRDLYEKWDAGIFLSIVSKIIVK